jgi:hypothetical protein
MDFFHGITFTIHAHKAYIDGFRHCYKRIFVRVSGGVMRTNFLVTKSTICASDDDSIIEGFVIVAKRIFVCGDLRHVACQVSS